MDEREFHDKLSALQERVLSNALSEDEETNYTESLFESIRHVNEYGQEFWYARELQVALEYKQWRRFCNVIDKAKIACEQANNAVSAHFANVGKMVEALHQKKLEIFNYPAMPAISSYKMVIRAKK